MNSLSTADIELQIAQIALHFDPLKDDEIEWRYQPPPFVQAFAEFAEQFRRVPSQTEFKTFYFKKHREQLQREFAERWREVAVRNHKKRALAARVERAYPSFVRDIYFFALLREHGFAVEYDSAQDVESGVDLLVRDGDQKIQVHVFLGSPRSRQGRAKKYKRHVSVGRHVDIPLHREDCKAVGEFWLPTPRHVEMIKRRLHKS